HGRTPDRAESPLPPQEEDGQTEGPPGDRQGPARTRHHPQEDPHPQPVVGGARPGVSLVVSGWWLVVGKTNLGTRSRSVLSPTTNHQPLTTNMPPRYLAIANPDRKRC